MEVIIAVAPDHLAGLGGVAAALQAAGLLDAQVLEAAGVITGRVEAAPGEDPLAALRAVEGVASVEASRTIDIGPPDAPVQ